LLERLVKAYAAAGAKGCYSNNNYINCAP
jgi:hypothetical protein